MDIKFNCIKCGQSVVIDSAANGKLVECPNCKNPVRVPNIVPQADNIQSNQPNINIVNTNNMNAGYIKPPNSSFAIWSMWLGIASYLSCFITSIPAIICGCLAKKEIKESKGVLKGDGMATAGIVLGSIPLFFALIGGIGWGCAIIKQKQEAKVGYENARLEQNRIQLETIATQKRMEEQEKIHQAKLEEDKLKIEAERVKAEPERLRQEQEKMKLAQEIENKRQAERKIQEAVRLAEEEVREQKANERAIALEKAKTQQKITEERIRASREQARQDEIKKAKEDRDKEIEDRKQAEIDRRKSIRKAQEEKDRDEALGLKGPVRIGR